MQKVVVKAISGPHAGLTFWLANQEVSVGRRATSDIVLEHDQLLSTRHFRIAAIGGQVTITDLNSTNGTRVNGQKIHVSELKHGDYVDAGGSTFLVENSEAENPEDTAADGFDPDESYYGIKKSLPAQPPALPTSARAVHGLAAVHEVCPSGLQRISGDVDDETSPGQIANRLLGKENVLWIVDFARLGLPVPSELNIQSSSPFFKSFRDAAAQLPLILGPGEIENREPLMEAGWGADALVLVHSNDSKSDFMESLESVIHAQTGAPATNGICGACWPSILDTLLFADPAGLGRAFLKRVNAVFLEAEAGQQWHLFGQQDFIANLLRLGRIEMTDPLSDYEPLPNPTHR